MRYMIHTQICTYIFRQGIHTYVVHIKVLLNNFFNLKEYQKDPPPLELNLTIYIQFIRVLQPYGAFMNLTSPSLTQTKHNILLVIKIIIIGRGVLGALLATRRISPLSLFSVIIVQGSYLNQIQCIQCLVLTFKHILNHLTPLFLFFKDEITLITFGGSIQINVICSKLQTLLDWNHPIKIQDSAINKMYPYFLSS